MTADKKKQTPPQWLSSPPFYGHVGFDLDELADGHARLRMPFRDHLGNSRGEAHGGAIATLADGAMSQAVRSTLERGIAVATISMTVNYLAPGRGELVCDAHVVKGGHSVAFAEAEVRDERGKPVCSATAVYRILPRR